MRSFRFAYALLLALAVVTAGCSTVPSRATRADNYDKRLSRTRVTWIEPAELPIRITRGATGGVRPVIGTADRNTSNAGVGNLVSLLSHTPETVGKALAAANVEVTAPGAPALTTLRIRPERAETDCSPLYCIHALYLRASIYDWAEKKVVWSGSFRVGKPFSSTNDESVVESFTDALMFQLRGARLL